MAWLGAGLVAATAWQEVGTAPPGAPPLIAFRIGLILLLLALLTRVPAALAARAAPLGRLSLAIYALHVPVVYGWSTVPGLAWRVGPRLGAAEALGVALLVLASSFLAAWLFVAARHQAWKLVRAGMAAARRTSAASQLARQRDGAESQLARQRDSAER
jgi:hypothetical protein